jgi:hypothetical protein
MSQYPNTTPGLDITDYYNSIDFSHWQKKIMYNASKLHHLKTDKAKSGYLLELYSAYMQLAEILLINMKICTTRGRDFHKNLFIKNNELHQFIENEAQTAEFIDWFLTNYDFGIVEKSTIKNYQQKYELHKTLLEEVMEDYSKDFDFLNAYKHGYRVQGSTETQTFSIGIEGSQTVPFASYDVYLAYHSNGKDPSGQAQSLIFQNTIYMKLYRVVAKAAFITIVLENIKAILASQSEDSKNRPTKVTHFVLKDKKAWDESFGAFRWHEPVARIPRP